MDMQLFGAGHGRVVALLGGLTLAACGGGAEVAGTSASREAAQSIALEAASCAALVGRSVGDGSFDRGAGTVETAVWQPAQAAGNPAASTPDHCRLEGVINRRTNGFDGSEPPGATSGNASYGVGFRMRLPVAWNQKLYFEGVGGTAGNPSNALGGLHAAGATDNALLRGYAVVSSDTGHRTLQGVPNGSFRYGYDPQARLEYGYQFLPLVTHAARELIQSVYGQAPRRSYFLGTSGGGRQGMKATQMFPQLFDGVVSVVPAFRVPVTSVANMVMVQEQATIAQPGADGVTPDIATAFTRAQLQNAAREILQQCDGMDGLRDGMVFRPFNCRFNPQRLLCPAAKAAEGCFTQAQVDVFRRIHDGITQYAPWNYDPGLATGWPGHRLGSVNTVPGAPNNAAISTLMAGFLAYDSVTPPLADPAANLYQYMLNGDPVAEYAKLSATNARFPLPTTHLVDADSPNLDGFAQRKGRLLIVHGLADPFFSPVDLRNYLDRVIGRYGLERANDIVRAYFVPGMNHGTGGPTTDVADPLALLDSWVETGVAHDSYEARVNPANAAIPADWAPTRTRRICSYPAEAFYTGGDPEKAASFVCR